MSGSILTKPDATVDVLGLKVELKDFEVYLGAGNVHLSDRCYPEYSSIRMEVTIMQGGDVYRDALWIHLYSAHGIVSKPLIVPTWQGDLYLHMHHTNSTYEALVHALMGMEVAPEDLIIAVERIPLVHLVWVGTAMLSIGIVASLLRELVEIIHKPNRRRRSTEKREKVPSLDNTRGS